MIWQYVYTAFGYRYILLWVFGMVVAYFTISTVLSYLYSRTIQKLVHRANTWLYPRLLGAYERVEVLLLRLH